MKNKLYYILAVLYVLMFAFILYINGVFTGEVTSASNLFINIGFLVVQKRKKSHSNIRY